MAQASVRNQILQAIRAYESDPDIFNTEQLRNLMTFAQQEGIPFQPKFSLGRAAMNFANEATFGIVPGSDFALTEGEANFGTAGSLLSFLAPGLGIFKGAKLGSKALTKIAGGGLEKGAAKQFAKAAVRRDAGLARKVAEIDEKISAITRTTKSGKQVATKGNAEIRKALLKEKGALEALGGGPVRGQDWAMSRVDDIERLVGSNPAFNKGLENAINFGALGGFAGGANALQEGQDPFGGAIGGAIGGGLLGAIGGPALPHLKNAYNARPLLTTGALGLGASSLMFE